MGTRLKFYEIYSPNKTVTQLDDVVFLPEGFSFFAALFQPFWFAYHRLWGAAVICFALQFSLLYSTPIWSVELFAKIALFVLIGFHAYDIYRWCLHRRGYVCIDVTNGSSLTEAQKRFLDRHLTKN